MIVELNKIYVLTAPKATEGMTAGDDDFIESSFDSMMYVKMKKLHQATAEVPVKVVGKVFTHSDRVMQALMFFTDYPEKMAKQAVSRRVGELLGQKGDK
jgi:hypothetical protein